MNGAGGGAALSTLGLIDPLRKKGVESCIVCDEAGSAEEREALREAARGQVTFTPLYWWNAKIRSKVWKRPALEVRQWLRTGLRVGEVGAVVSAARRWGAELIHTNTILTPAGGFAAQLLGLGHVWHLRELIGAGQPFQLPLEGRALAAFMKAHASVVIANSNASAAALRDVLPAERLAVVPNGIDLEAFGRIGRRSGGHVVIGMVANLSSRVKKHELFVAAARQAPGAEYRLYGHAPAEGSDAYADEVRRKAEAGGVRIMGFVDARAVMAELDVLVHTADGESFGRTVVEAMAAGLPVVGVAGGGVGETVVHGETGLLAPPDSSEALAVHLRTLIADPSLRKRLGAAGRERALREYSLSACGDRVADVYKRALKAPVESGATIFSLLGVLP
ncbi:MAG: glycosyltransferase family 4 protein [Myxococcaceae bacterium]|nr:glycosyltransferase family 4 protein [Myxococcaceae bacterium]